MVWRIARFVAYMLWRIECLLAFIQFGIVALIALAVIIAALALCIHLLH